MTDNKAKWQEAMDRLSKCSKEKRDHFANLIMSLADCYREDDTEPEAQAVVLLVRGDVLAMFSAGADAMCATDMVCKATEALISMAMAEAPTKEMFN
jgi:hypothetical protein